MLIEDSIRKLSQTNATCLRIKKTPLVYGYAVHIRTVLLLYFSCLPVVFYSFNLSPETVACIMILVSHALLTLDELAVQCEMPFGHLTTHLPLEVYCNSIFAHAKLFMQNSSYLRAVIHLEKLNSRSRQQADGKWRESAQFPIHHRDAGHGWANQSSLDFGTAPSL